VIAILSARRRIASADESTAPSTKTSNIVEHHPTSVRWERSPLGKRHRRKLRPEIYDP